MPLPDAPLHPLRRALRKALAHARARAARKLEQHRAALANPREAERWRENGELLKAHLDRVPARADAVELPDLFRSGSTRRIELDPRLKPMDNARRYFKKYRKRRDAQPHLEREAANAAAELEAVSTLLADFLAWDAGEPPPEPPSPEWGVRARAVKVHVPGLEPSAGGGAEWAPGAGPAPRQASRRPSGPALADVARRFASRDGLDIWVGQSAADNDILTGKLARGNDWWLHVAHHTGSHVLVKGMERLKKTGERSETFLPQETLLDAAHLAVHYSKARHAGRAEVDYTQAKHVRKERGATAGQASLGRYRVLTVRMESARLERLLRGPGATGAPGAQ